MEYREPTYEALEIGEIIEDNVHADDLYVKSFVFAFDDDPPWYTPNDTPFSKRIGPLQG